MRRCAFLLILLSISCGTVERVDFPLHYPCDAFHPCDARTQLGPQLLLAGQRDTCGGSFSAIAGARNAGITRVHVRCDRCKRETDFYFRTPDAPVEDKTILPGFQHALMLAGDGLCGEAIPWLRDVVQAEPLFVQARLLLTDCLISDGDLKGADASLREASRVAGSSPDYYRLSAAMAIALGDTEAYDREMAKYRSLIRLVGPPARKKP